MFVASNEARNKRHTAQHIADRADVKAGLVAAACTVIQHWNPVALHYRVWCYVDWLKGAEIDQGQLQVTVLFAALSSRAYCAVKEQLCHIRPLPLMPMSYFGSKSSGWLGLFGNGAIKQTQSCFNRLYSMLINIQYNQTFT